MNFKGYPAVVVWNQMYHDVLGGHKVGPRGRQTVEVLNAQWTLWPGQHIDPRKGRNVSLDYVRREFMWYQEANRFDTAMTAYAPIWKTCIDEDGGINSNYGQYLFANGFQSPFFLALNQFIVDQDSRRVWIPIFQSRHHRVGVHNDYPCHTGIGFRIHNSELRMSVHHRSLDMWHGAANDFPIAYFWQLLASAYLRMNGLKHEIGPIVHMVESAHFYERHISRATQICEHTYAGNERVTHANHVLADGFSAGDMLKMFNGTTSNADSLSPALDWMLSFDGDYGRQSPRWEHVYDRAD